MAALAVRNLPKRLFDYAMARQLVTFNPGAAIPAKSIATPKTRERVMSPTALQTYLTTLYASDIARRYTLALHLILISLVRKSELVFAKWSDLDLESREWHIPAQTSKSGKPRVVDLPTQAVALFEELRHLATDAEHVLPGRNRPKQHGVKTDVPPLAVAEDIRAFRHVRSEEAVVEA